MIAHHPSHSGLQSPLRNRYYYGKVLDVYHFELETAYANQKRWLLNRLVLGRGVICGLDVRSGHGDDELVVGAGVAIDGWGREIVVPAKKHVRIPVDDAVVDEHCHKRREEHDHCITLWLCYHECEVDPTPVVTSECGTERCAPGAIRESYRFEFRPGRLDPCPPPDPDDLVCEGQIRQPDLARWVSRSCDAVPDDPCIPLASIDVWHDEEGCGCEEGDIDISVRPIVFTNRLLATLVMGPHAPSRTSKPRY